MTGAFQDMPPPGGFGTINVERTFAKPLVRQGIWAAVLVGLSINGFFYLKKFMQRNLLLTLERNEHYIAAEPFLIVESERMFLRHLRNLREEERELMKHDPNWKVGTLYGELPFKTLPPDSLPPINSSEWYVHRGFHEFHFRVINPDHHQ